MVVQGMQEFHGRDRFVAEPEGGERYDPERNK